MNQDTGVLRKSLLSLRKEPTVSFDPRWTVAYKHFLIFFCQSKTSDESDCVVFDTEKGTTFTFDTGLQFEERSDFTVCYWKDNIFVFYGGFRHKPDEPRGGLYNPEKLVHFLNVIENEGKISFTIESFPLADNQFWNSRHSAHIYRDNMYVLRGSNEAAHHEAFFKLDLNEKTWNRCKTGGDTPKSSLHTTVLSNGKIYFFVTDPNAGSPFRGGGGGGGGLFGNMGKTTAGGGFFGGFGGQATRIEEVPLNFCVLDLETIKWQQIHKDKILSPSLKSGFFAETVGDRIYIWHRDLDEFLVYDPANNTILRSEGLPPNENWIIKSFQGSSIIFRIYHSPNESWIEYQSLGTSDQPEKQEEKIMLADPLVDSYQQLPHMEYIWKEKPFADITFVVGTEEIQTHRAILLKCRYFQNMFKSGMMEANSNKINVPDISSVNFKAILEYIYLDKIALTEVLAMELIILADLYFLPSLKADCEKYLSEKLTIFNFVEIMRVAQTADSEKLEKRVVGFLTSNIEKIKQEIDIHVIPPELFIRAIVDLKSPKK